MDEILHLHLLELTSPEGEVAWSDLVSEGLSNLCDPEGDPLSTTRQDILEVDEYPLCSFGPEVDHGCLALDRAHEGLEHEVEHPRLAEGITRPTDGALSRLGDSRLIGAEAAVTVLDRKSTRLNSSH